jgi:cytochrome c
MRYLFVVIGAMIVAAAAPLAAQQQATAPDGEQVFRMVCAMCHSVSPPATTLAPPIAHAAAYYVRRYPAQDSAVAAMVAFLREPAAERSVMPAHAVERFGLMPAQSHLPDAMLAAAARYVLSLADTAHVRHPPHR